MAQYGGGFAGGEQPALIEVVINLQMTQVVSCYAQPPALGIAGNNYERSTNPGERFRTLIEKSIHGTGQVVA